MLSKNKNKIIVTVILLITTVMSFSVFAKIATSPKLQQSTIDSLNEKKMTVLELTGATATVSTLLALVPGDSTTPIANKILDISGYLLIISAAILLEKFMLDVVGILSFKIVIPLACIICIFNIFLKKEVLKTVAIKLFLFGVAIVMIIPVSVNVSDLIYTNHKQSIEQTISLAAEMNETKAPNSDNSEANQGFLGGLSKVSDTISEWRTKAENALSNFIDAVAVLLITTCVIPILIIFIMVWIVKLIFGINIPLPKKMNLFSDLKHKTTQKNKNSESATTDAKENIYA